MEGSALSLPWWDIPGTDGAVPSMRKSTDGGSPDHRQPLFPSSASAVPSMRK